MQPQENFLRKYYTEQEWIERTQLREQWEDTPTEERERWWQACQQLFADIEAGIDLDPASAAAQAFTKRWLQFATFPNEAITSGGIEAWKDRHN